MEVADTPSHYRYRVRDSDKFDEWGREARKGKFACKCGRCATCKPEQRRRGGTREVVETKRCSTCKETKGNQFFYRHSSQRDGLQANCIACCKARDHRRRKKKT